MQMDLRDDDRAGHEQRPVAVPSFLYEVRTLNSPGTYEDRAHHERCDFASWMPSDDIIERVLCKWPLDYRCRG